MEEAVMREVLAVLICATALSSAPAQGQEAMHVLWKATDRKQVIGNTTFYYTEYSALPDKAEFSSPNGREFFNMAQSCAAAMTDSLLFSADSKAKNYQRLMRNYLKAKEEYLRTGVIDSAKDGQFDISHIRWTTEEKGGGFWVCADGTLLAGPTRHLSSPIFGLQAGLEAFKNHSAWMIDVTLGIGRYTRYYDNVSVLSENGKTVPYAAVSGYYAYRLPLSGQSVLSLFAGAGYSFLGLKNQTALEWESQYQGITVSEGIALDVFSSRSTVDFRESRHVCSRGGLRVKLYSGQILLLPQNCLVPTLNLGIGYVFSSKNARTTYD